MHDQALHVGFLLLGHLAGSVEHVFKFSAFEDHRLEADFSEEFPVVHRGNNHPDAAGESRVVAHDPICAAGRVVGARGTDGIEIDDDGFVAGETANRIVEHIGGRDFPPGRIHLQDDGFDLLVVLRLLQSGFEVIHHRVAEASGGSE